MPTNFELKRLKPKLDIVEKPENRVHKLTDSNGALEAPVDPKVTFIKREKYDPPQASRYFIRLTHARSSYGSHSLNLGVLCYAILLSSNIIF